MKLRFIYPRFKKFLEDIPTLKNSLKEYIVGDYTMPPSLALPTIAAMTPDEFEVNLTDDNIFQKINFDEDVDLVVVSCFTPQAQRAYEILDEFKKRGTRTIAGGMHPTTIPDEVLEHADSICIGEAEPVWNDILNDLKNDTMQRVYQQKDAFDMKQYPIPDRELFSQKTYKWNAHLVLTMRGCPVRCSACPIPPKEGHMFRFRPVDNIIEDIESLPYKEFYFTDDQIMLPGKRNRKFITRVMERTKDLDISIFLSSTMSMMSVEPDLFRMLHTGKTTSMYTIFGFDPVSVNLFSKDCTQSQWQNAVDTVKCIEDNGIHFFGSIGVGFDDQDNGIFDRILRFCKDTEIDLAEFFIATPFPGTPFGDLCIKEDRVIHRNYSLWNQANVVFKPKNFTEKELMDGFFKLWEDFYKNIKYEKTVRSFSLTKD